MIRIYAKKAFEFENGNEKVRVDMASFNDVPEWVPGTQMFKLASSCEPPEVFVVNGTQDEKQAEESPKEDPKSSTKSK